MIPGKVNEPGKEKKTDVLHIQKNQVRGGGPAEFRCLPTSSRGAGEGKKEKGSFRMVEWLKDSRI